MSNNNVQDGSSFVVSDPMSGLQLNKMEHKTHKTEPWEIKPLVQHDFEKIEDTLGSCMKNSLVSFTLGKNFINEVDSKKHK